MDQKVSLHQSYKIKTHIFEGPLDLLLDLVEKRKLFINDISLATVTDDFIKYIEGHQDTLEHRSEFIVVASTLLLIKSRSLLPNLPLSDEEKTSIEELENRLNHYKKIKDLSIHIKEIFGDKIAFTKLLSRNFVPVFLPSPEISLDSLLSTAKSILNSIKVEEKLPEVIVKKVVSIEEMIDKLVDRVKKTISTSFRDFANVGKAEKVEVIVSFLALLELVKQGMIDANQKSDFDDITLHTEEVATPRYG